MNGISQNLMQNLLEQAKKHAKKKRIKLSKLLVDFHPDFLSAFLEMDGDKRNLAWAFLSGQNIHAADMRELNVHIKITSDENAETMLFEFLKLLKIFDYKGVILLIDEFEYIFTAAGARRGAQLIVTFKDIFDKVNERIVRGEDLTKPLFVIACTPGTWDEEIPELMERVGMGGVRPFWERVHDKYSCPPFTIEETKELIVERLRKRRTKDIRDPLYPFTPDYIKFVHEITGGNPRKILKRTGLILEIADEGELKEIKAVKARQILKEHRII